MLRYLSIVFMLLYVASGVPSKYSQKNEGGERVLYDQRQEGEWNVRADLKNFVILIIPKNVEAQENSPSLLDSLFRAHPKHHGKRAKHPQQAPKGGASASETMHFIESKTAPYHVDISKSTNHLLNDEILATQSPPIKLNKTNEEPPLVRQLRSTRLAKAFVLTVPEEEFVLTKMEDNRKVVKKDGFGKVGKNSKEEMTLLGASEQCGPEMHRDSEGVCRFISKETI